MGRDRSTGGLHHLTRVRVAYHTARAAWDRVAVPRGGPRGFSGSGGGRDAVPEVVRGDAHHHAHAPPLDGGDLRDHGARRGAVRAPRRTLEALPRGGAVRRPPRVILGDVADAIRGSALQLAARGIEHGACGHILCAVVSDSEGAWA